MARNPLYFRIQRDIADSIGAGEYPPGARIPSEAALAERYGVTRMTVRQAVDGLISDGLVTRRQGSGTYVLPAFQARRALNRLTGFTEDMRQQGRRATSMELDRREVEPPDAVREQLDLQDGAHVVLLERLRSLDDEPVALHRVWLPLWLAPELARRSMKGASLYETLEREHGVRLSTARQRITAVVASKRQAELLGVARGSPLLFTERLTRDVNNRPVEFAEAWLTPKLPLWVELER
ncbi:MAG TPA: GntR family transcriptional regulator [Gaiellaceae bacterium]|nr:GntR family transcriptional regulator [Gaiellaceae bacterium]